LYQLKYAFDQEPGIFQKAKAFSNFLEKDHVFRKLADKPHQRQTFYNSFST